MLIPTLTKNKNADLHKRVIRNFPTRRVFNGDLNDTLAVDLIDLSRNPQKKDRKTIKYIMISVELVSRKVQYALLQNKTTTDLKNGLETIFSKYGFKPNRIWADQEGGLISNEMKKHLSEKNIILYHTYGSTNAPHNPVAERQIRTIKETLIKYEGSVVDNIDEYVKFYNNREHTITKYKPNEINKKNKNIVADVVFKSFIRASEPIQKYKFKVGEKVRLVKKAGILEKKTTAQKLTSEIFTIDEILNTHPITYKVKDDEGETIEGSFYEQELSKV